jgi:phage terminase small subunit|tara:strand:- start:755 stop:1408 length:654 start_codon:yes stop_codon:yes gene_type:complete
LTFLTEENMAVRKRASKIDGKPRETRGRPPVTTASPLTRKQELFVKEIVSKDGQITLREAAVNAGYSVGSAHTRAYELTNPHISPHVVAAIQAYRRELDEKYGVTYQRHLRDLQQIRDTALQNGAYSAAVQAEYRRGQAQGDIYVSKSEIRHGSIDSMSKDEVLKALEEIKNSYAPVTIDITPEENASNRDKARGRLLQASEGSSAEVETEAAFDED